MSSRTHGGHRNSRGAGGFSKRSARGLFKDNIWYCDCDPRLPAEHFKVKKEGKNQGRWFHTCQQSEPKRCSFFLWDEDAKPREQAAVLGNSHAEPSAPGQQGKTQDMRRHSPFRGALAEPVTPTSVNPKRSAHVAGLDRHEEEDYEWGMSHDDEQAIAHVAAEVEPHTPNKAAKMGVYATPSVTATTKRKIPWLEPLDFTLPTSPSGGIDTPTKTLSPDHTQDVRTPEMSRAPVSDPCTPLPAVRFKDALVNPADSAASLTVEALSVLASIPVPDEVISRLRSVLSKHDLKTRGVIKGRDISRLALEAKTAKIAELEAKIVSLQADRELDRNIIRNLRRQRQGQTELDNGARDEL